MIKNIFKSEFSRILLSFASSQVIGNILRMIAGFLTVRMVTPDVFGYFSGKGIFLGYLSLASVGILNGLNRDLPFEQGRSNFDKVHELAGLGFWVSLFIGIPSTLVLMGMGVNAFINSTIDDALLYFTYASSAFFLLLNKFYLPILYRTNKDFTKLSTITIYTAIINIVSLIFNWVYGKMSCGA